MNYINHALENKEYVDEIRRRKHFDNFNNKLPDVRANRPHFLDEKLEDYPADSRDRAAEILENMALRYEKETLPFYKVIDKFIEETGFDLGRFREEFERSYSSRIDCQLMLCPLYIHLRKAGYSEEFIVR